MKKVDQNWLEEGTNRFDYKEILEDILFKKCYYDPNFDEKVIELKEKIDEAKTAEECKEYFIRHVRRLEEIADEKINEMTILELKMEFSKRR